MASPNVTSGKETLQTILRNYVPLYSKLEPVTYFKLIYYITQFSTCIRECADGWTRSSKRRLVQIY